MKSKTLIALFLLNTFSAYAHEEYADPSAVGTPTKCQSNFSSPQALAKSENCRYIYSKSWGWIDLKHFGAATRIVSIAKHVTEGSHWMFYAAIIAGESHEQFTQSASSYSYEDLVSNFLGASFQHMYNLHQFANLNFSSALKFFFRSIDVTEDPVHDSPNYNDLLKGNVRNSINKDYFPLYTTQSSLSWNPIQIELNVLRLEVTALITSNTVLREKVLHFLEQDQMIRDILNKIDSAR